VRRQRRDDASQRNRSVVTKLDGGVMPDNMNGKIGEIGRDRRIDLNHVVACGIAGPEMVDDVVTF